MDGSLGINATEKDPCWPTALAILAWRAVDAWGLNDAWIAHHGGVTAEYLDRYRPEIVAFHAYYGPSSPQEGRAAERGLPGWYRMCRTLQQYAESRGYTLAAAYGEDGFDTHWYFVKPGFPDHDAVVDTIRGVPYLWNGRPVENLAP